MLLSPSRQREGPEALNSNITCDTWLEAGGSDWSGFKISFLSTDTLSCCFLSLSRLEIGIISSACVLMSDDNDKNKKLSYKE